MPPQVLPSRHQNNRILSKTDKNPHSSHPANTKSFHKKACPQKIPLKYFLITTLRRQPEDIFPLEKRKKEKIFPALYLMSVIQEWFTGATFTLFPGFGSGTMMMPTMTFPLCLFVTFSFLYLSFFFLCAVALVSRNRAKFMTPYNIAMINKELGHQYTAFKH